MAAISYVACATDGRRALQKRYVADRITLLLALEIFVTERTNFESKRQAGALVAVLPLARTRARSASFIRTNNQG